MFTSLQNELDAFLKQSKNERSKGFFGRLMNSIPDLDEIFSYHTQQELNVLDRRLGYVFYIAFFFIFVYIAIYVNQILSLILIELRYK